MEKIGIVGFGVMGKAIAHNLSNSGYRVLINDKSDDSLAIAKKNGYKTYETPKEIALNSKKIIPEYKYVFRLNSLFFSIWLKISKIDEKNK